MEEKINKVNLLTDVEFIDIINRNLYLSDVVREIGMAVRGSAYKTIKKRMKTLGIDDQKFRNNLSVGRSGPRKQDDNFFIENSKYHAGIKKRIIDKSLIPYCCEKCQNTGLWQNEKIVLQLDHKNGIKTDNRLENLRFLCPNCHSQTETYAGNRFKKPQKYCVDCSDAISCDRTRCEKCRRIYQKNTNKKIDWPSPEIMEKWVWEKPTEQISKELKVSDIAVANFCKRHHIQKPARGYWIKKRYGKI